MTKAELIKELEEVDDNTPIAINVGLKADNISISCDPKDNYKSVHVEGWHKHKDVSLCN